MEISIYANFGQAYEHIRSTVPEWNRKEMFTVKKNHRFKIFHFKIYKKCYFFTQKLKIEN